MHELVAVVMGSCHSLIVLELRQDGIGMKLLIIDCIRV